MKPRVRRHHPEILGLATFAALCYFDLAPFAGRLSSDVLPTAVAVAAILAGFTAMSQSIFLATIDAPVMEYLRSKGCYDQLVDREEQSFHAQRWFIGVGLIGMALHATGPWNALVLRVAIAAIAAIGVYAWFHTGQQVRLMFEVLRRKDES